MIGAGVVMMAAARATPAADRLAALAALEAEIAAARGRQFALLAALDEDPVTVSLPSAADRFGADKRWAIEDVAGALRISPGQARARLADAVEARRVPRLLGLLTEGEITERHLNAVLDHTRLLPDDSVVARIEDQLLPGPGELAGESLGRWRARIRRAVLKVTGPAAVEERRIGEDERRVWLRPLGAGMTELWALLPDEDAAALMTAVQALAGQYDAADGRTADQRRADALTQLGTDALAGRVPDRLANRPGLCPAVQVTVALSTLLHLDEQPGELDGVGPIPAGLARRLAHDPSGTWRRLVTDDLGKLVDYGREKYRPPTELAEHVVARDRTCRFPYCGRPAGQSDLDHTVTWAAGGHTNADNLAALCSRHHHLRHDTGWHYRRLANGDTEWTTPTGEKLIAPFATYPVDTTMRRTDNYLRRENDHDPPPF